MRAFKYFFLTFLFFFLFFFFTYITINFFLQSQSTIKCPQVVGKQLIEAKKIFEKNGLFLEVLRFERRDDVPDGTVIFQTPIGDTDVKKGRRIYVVVSRGPRIISCPDLLERKLEEAEQILREKGLKIAKLVRVPNPKEGIVIAQIPFPFEEVMEGKGIKVFVGSRQKIHYFVPEINSSNIEKIKEELEEKGIKYKILFERNENYGIIPSIRTSKEEGKIMDPNEELIITVGIKGL